MSGLKKHAVFSVFLLLASLAGLKQVSLQAQTLDEKALRQVSSYRYARHNCGVCKISMAVSIDFQGPVWMREPAFQTVSIAR